MECEKYFPDQKEVERIMFKILAHYGIDLYDDVQQLKTELGDMVEHYDVPDVNLAISLAESTRDAELILEIYHAIWELEFTKNKRKNKRRK